MDRESLLAWARGALSWTVLSHGWVRQAFTKRSLVRSRTTPICDGRLEAAEPHGWVHGVSSAVPARPDQQATAIYIK